MPRVQAGPPATRTHLDRMLKKVNGGIALERKLLEHLLAERIPSTICRDRSEYRFDPFILRDLAALLPPAETPAHTEGYEGFYHLHKMSGVTEEAELQYIIRDHDGEKFLARKQTMRDAADYLNKKYGEGTVELVLRDSYFNMCEMIEPHPELVALPQQAMRECGIAPQIIPIRGGTDGAKLSFRGLP